MDYYVYKFLDKEGNALYVGQTVDVDRRMEEHKGRIWDIEKDLFGLVKLCSKLLSDDPLFFTINTYTTSLSKEVFSNILKLTVGSKYKGKIYSEEIGLLAKENGLILPCGIVSRYENE